MQDPEIEAFNEAQSVKWMKLPKAYTVDLADELSRREGVTSRKLFRGDRLELYGPCRVIIVDESKQFMRGNM